MPDPWYKDHLPFFARVPANELPYGYTDGYIVEIPIVEPPRYLNRLVEQFKAHGGVINQREIQSLADLPNHLIVNCSGVYARQVANDPLVYPLRGQVVKVNAPHIREAMMDDDTFTYILPRRDGCILGGVSQKDNWSLKVDPVISTDITRRCAIFEPSVQQAEVISVHVGLRPGRHEVRLEMEQIASSHMIHNYGHGGLGFTLSWGCAYDVAELAATV
jgi:D-amino-acid oxidase